MIALLRNLQKQRILSIKVPLQKELQALLIDLDIFAKLACNIEKQ